MEVPKLNVSVVRSSNDESLYCFYYSPLPDSPRPQLHPHARPNDFVKKGTLVAELAGEEGPVMVKSPLSGVVQESGLLGGKEEKGQRVLLFSIKLCEHYPRKNKLAGAEDLPAKFNDPIFNAFEYCAVCEEPLWFYYDSEEKAVTFSQLRSYFDDFNLSDLQWKVVLNEHFTPNTEIVGTSDETFSLPDSGKPVFLQDIGALQAMSSIPPEHVMMRYKKVVCQHQKISDNRCQFCLATLAEIGPHKLKRYLFQVAEHSGSRDVWVSGKALEEEEAAFKERIVGGGKALLVLDLDNTILHSIQLFKVPEDARETISDYLIIPPESECFIERSFVKIRPYFEDFLKIILPIYDIFVYTKGTRMYAEEICRALRKKYDHILGSSKNFTRSWLISRDEDPNMKKSLNFVLPNLRDFILILDDRRDVWDHSPLCIFTKPYYYFFFFANVEGKIKLEAAEWEKGGGSLEKNANLEAEHTVPKHEKVAEQPLAQDPVDPSTAKVDAIEEKGSSILRLSQSPDSFLLYAALTMLKSHEFYFRNRAMKDCPKKKLGKWADMAQVQKEIRGSILKGVQVEILIPNYKVNNNAYRRAIKLSLGIIENKETIPHFVIRANDYRKHASQFNEISMRLKNYSQACKIPVVSESWIDLCYEYSFKFPHDNFICSSPTATMVYPTPEDLERVVNRTLEESRPEVEAALGIRCDGRAGDQA